jgi:hypothetical protein
MPNLGVVRGGFYGGNNLTLRTAACTVVPSIPITILTLSWHHNPALGIELLWYKEQFQLRSGTG